MRLTSNHLVTLLAKLQHKVIRAVLIYGPDNGMCSYCYQQIVKGLDWSVRRVNYSEINERDLALILNNTNLFSSREIVKIENMTAKIDRDTEELLRNSDMVNLPIFMTEDLNKNSNIRQLFENSKDLAIISCYPDENESIRNIIREKISILGKSITSAAEEYLLANLVGDRLLIISELDKLLYFTFEQKIIELATVKEVINEGNGSSVDLLFFALAENKADIYFTELNKLFDRDIPALWIVRGLSRYYFNLYKVLNAKVDIKIAIRALNPPIFFKHLPRFTDIACKISIFEVNKMLGLLCETEVKLKSIGINPMRLCEGIFINFYNEVKVVSLLNI